MAIDVLDPSLELRVRLVSEIAGQKRREWACRPVNGCRRLLSLGYYPVRRCGGWRDGCGVVVVAMGRLMCPLVYAKGQIVREGCGADRALTSYGGCAGKVALLPLPLLPVLVLLQMPPLTPRPGVSPPERVTESGSESEVEPRVTKEGDSALMVLSMLLCVRPRDSESEESGKGSIAGGLEFLRG